MRSANAENRRAQEDLKRLHERIEAAEKTLADTQSDKRELAFLTQFREYIKIVDAAGVDDIIGNIFTAVIDGHIEPTHVWFEFSYWAWRNGACRYVCRHVCSGIQHNR